MLYLCVTAECPQLRPAEDIVSGLKGALLLSDSQRFQGVKVKTLLVLLTLRDEASRMRSKPATFTPESGKPTVRTFIIPDFHSLNLCWCWNSCFAQMDGSVFAGTLKLQLLTHSGRCGPSPTGLAAGPARLCPGDEH